MSYLRFLILTLIFSSLSSCSSRARLVKKGKPIPTDVLTHNYSDILQQSDCGDEPIVRFVSFAFDKRDSLRIDINLTTSLREQKITGSLNVLLDEYELEYSNTPVSKLYIETLEVGVQNRYPSPFRSNYGLTNAILRSSSVKGRRQQSAKQYWNSIRITFEPEDVALIKKSKDIRFLIKTKNCVLDVYPSIRQTVELKQFLQ